MSDYYEAFNINICKDNCNFECISTEFTPNGYSYYKCSKCEKTMKKRHNTTTTDKFLRSETTRSKK